MLFLMSTAFTLVFNMKSLCHFGEAVFFNGKYEDDLLYPLYIQMLTCSFTLKKNKIPTIQLKKHLSFLENEYLENSNNEVVCLVLTNIDLQLFLEHYDVDEVTYRCGWKFKSVNGLFTEYIDKWIKRKNEATISGNLGIRQLSKLQLNSLYGKFATKIKTRSKIPFLRKR